jgi:DNA-binding response OmpR family regulator
MSRVLLVEDDLALRTGLGDTLAQEGHEVTTATDGARARALLESRRFDLVVLDLMLPRLNGLDVLRELRRRDGETPVLILTAKDGEADKVLGLELGADDYVTKPFGLRELLARVRALLRRAERAPAARPAPRGRLSIGDARVDLDAFEVVRDGQTTALSQKEAAMLALLAAEAGRAISRDRFLAEVWQDGGFVGHRTVDTHVWSLRQKIEPDPAEPRFLLTVHGIGYKLALAGRESRP